MLAIGDEKRLYLLEFVDSPKLVSKIRGLKCEIEEGSAQSLLSIKKELKGYFAGELTTFLTPIAFLGTSFQKRVWQGLQKIAYGKTRSYGEMAAAIAKPTAYRALANANGANPLAIIVPCHRVIAAEGRLGGYAGGIEKKQWLLTHENNHCSQLPY